MRWAIFVVYALLLFIGAGVIYWREPTQPTSFVAERKMAANRLLQAGDLAPVSGDHAQYLKHPIEKGKKLEPDDISPAPILTPKPGKLPVAFSLEWQMVQSGAVNAGSLVRVCQAGKVVLEPAEI